MPSRLRPPDTVKKIAQRLEDAGFETWCVGGAIRDALLGHEHLDWDLATAATPVEVQKLFRRTIPVGVEFGTVGVFDSGVMHEVTTFRRDVRTDGRHAVVEFGVSLDEDLARRDYTINAIAYSPKRQEIRDPFGGQKDIESGIIRAVGNPGERMREDRLRALRAIRFAARFGFQIDPATWEAIVESAPHLGRLSAERVKQEIEKTMDQVAFPSRAFSMWAKSGAFATLIPSLATVTVAQLAALDHLRRDLLPRRPQRRVTRIAALFSLAAPPFVTDEQRAAEVKRQLEHRPFDVRAILKGLRFSNAESEWIGTLVARWHTLAARMTESMLERDGPDDATLRRWASAVGRTRLASLFRLADAFWWASRQAGESAPRSDKIAAVYRRAIRIAYHDPIEISDLAVDGDDLQQLGVSGPALGVTLRKLLEVVIHDPGLNTRDQLLALVNSDFKP